VDAAIDGLRPLDPGQLVNLSVEQLRQMSMSDVVAFAYQLGIDVQKVRAERGKLLTEIMKHAHDA
jgi:hypothetical protein